jgi:hypothetical protein
MLIRRAIVVAFGASIVLACSGGTTGGAASASSFVQQYCQLIAPCCAKAGKPSDGSQCEAFFNAFTSNEVYDATKGQACLDAARAKSNDPDFCTNSGSDPACNGVYSKAGAAGGKAPGALCTDDSECASSTEGAVTCKSTYDSKGAVTKTCQVQIDGKEGDTPCLGTKDGNLTSFTTSSSTDPPPPPPPKGYVCDVAKGIYCDSKSVACKKIADIGADCDTSSTQYACVKTAYCDFSTKKCVARPALGADCTPFSTPCADKAYCDDTTKKCTATLADGAPCTSSQQCASDSCVNKACGKSGSSDFGLTLLCGN